MEGHREELLSKVCYQMTSCIDSIKNISLTLQTGSIPDINTDINVPYEVLITK